MARVWLSLALSLALGVASLWLVLPDAFDRQLVRALGRVGGLELAGLLGLVGLWWLLSAWRLRFLAHATGGRLSLVGGVQAHVAGVFGAAVTPAGGGNSLGIALLLYRLGLTSEAAVAVAVMSLVGDLVFFCWALPTFGIYLHLGGVRLPIEHLGWVIAGTSVLALVTSWLLAFRLDLAVRATRRLARLPWLRRLRPRLEEFLERLELAGERFALRPWSWHLRFHLLSGAGRVVHFLVLNAVLVALGLRFEQLVVLGVQILVHAFAFVVPTPGASGYQEAAITFALRGRVPSTGLSAAVILWRVLQHYVYFLAGPLLGGPALLRRNAPRPAGDPPTGPTS